MWGAQGMRVAQPPNKNSLIATPQRPAILVGAEAPLPEGYVYREWAGYSLHVAHRLKGRWSEHVHDQVQVAVASEGAEVEATWRSSNGTLTRRAATGAFVSIVPCGQRHTCAWKRSASVIHVYLSPEAVTNAAAEAVKREKIEIMACFLERDPLIEEIGKSLARKLWNGSLTNLFASSAINVLAAHLLERYSGQVQALRTYRDGLPPSRLRHVVEYIDAHMGDDVSLEQLAAQADMSPHYFSQLFHRSTGSAPHQYLLKRRVERAKELLAGQQAPLADIAYRLGFSSQAQFTTTFRRYTGETPSRYRKRS